VQRGTTAMGTPRTVHLLQATPPAGPPRREPALAALRTAGRWPRRRWFKRGLAIAGIMIAGALAQGTLFRPELTPVTVNRVSRGLVEETVTNSKAGTVRSRLRAELSTEIGGRVVSVPVRAGARVRRGDVLVKLADEDWRAQRDLQQRALDAARAEERRACVAATGSISHDWRGARSSPIGSDRG